MKLSEIDAALIRFADTLSPAEISIKIDGVLTPEQVAARTSKILMSRDWLDQTQQDRLVTMKMRQLIVELEEMPRTTRNAEVLIKALDTLGNRLDRRIQATEQDLSRLYAFQGAVMLDAVMSAIQSVRPLTESTTPPTDAEWTDAVEVGIRHAQLELAKHEGEGEDS